MNYIQETTEFSLMKSISKIPIIGHYLGFNPHFNNFLTFHPPYIGIKILHFPSKFLHFPWICCSHNQVSMIVIFKEY